MRLRLTPRSCPLSSARLPPRRVQHLLRGDAVTQRTFPLAVSVREAAQQDYWAAAEVHVSAFHRRRPPLAYHLAKIARFNDIVHSSDVRFLGDSLLGRQGRYVCLVAQCLHLQEAQEEHTSAVTSVLRSVYPAEVRDGIVERPLSSGICGVMNVDTTGRFVPSMTLVGETENRRQRPQGCAYFSNLSVLPTVQRRGIGTSLIREAERLSAEWGCWGASLHCSRENQGAFQLYTKHGYALVEGAPPDKNNCIFLAKIF